MKKKSATAAEVKAVLKKGPLESRGQLTAKVKAKAYEFWEKQGKKNGNDQAHWLEAEKIIKSQAT